MKTLILVGSLLLVNSVAHAGTANLQSTGGEQITVFATPIDAVGNTVASAKVELNVTLKPGADCNESVDAYLQTFCGGAPFHSESVHLSMTNRNDQGACQFQKSDLDIPYYTHAGQCNQLISVSVGANKLKDPVNGTENFQFVISYK